MSHVVSIQTRLDDLEAVKRTCIELSKKYGIALTFKEGQKTYKWWGHSVGDYPIPHGFTAEELGHCEHAITVEGAGYEVGLARAKDGKGYVLLFDFFGQGQRILDAFCTPENAAAVRTSKAPCTAGRFMQAYGVNKAELAARKLGYQTTRQTLQNGAVNVLVRGRF